MMERAPWCWLCMTPSPLIEGLSEPAYYHCPRCQLIFIDRKYLPDGDKERRIYELHENTWENAGYVRMLTRFLDETVHPFIQPPGRALDFGSGPGPVLAGLMMQCGFSVTCYDPYFSPDSKWEQSQYDVITTTEVLEHLHHPAREFSRLFRLLTPGGILAVMTQHHDDHDFSTWWYRRDPTHVCFYALETLRWIAGHWGFLLRKVGNGKYAVLQKPSSA